MKLSKIYTGMGLLAVCLSFGACKDSNMDEIMELQVDRSFSPTNVTANVINKTGVRLNWKAVHNANSYTIEVYENAAHTGTPTLVVKDILAGMLPYTINGLGGDTEYFIRIKAVGTNVSDSKWMDISIKTEAEQILNPVNPADLTATSVVLTWPAGQMATSMVVNPGNITKAITAADVAAGKVTVTGLKGETTYTAAIFNGTKVRGSISFTTLLDLGGATQITPADNLVNAINNAEAGAVLALMPGIYTLNADLMVSKNISIKGARPTDKPVIIGGVFRVKGNAALNLKDLVLDGTGALNNNQMIIYEEASDNAYGHLVVEDAEIKNYVKGLVYANVKTLIESVKFSGNIISAIECNGGDFIDFRNGIAKTFNFNNNTVYNSALARDLFRMDAGGGNNFTAVTSIINISNNTFHNITNGAGNRILYIRLPKHEITFSKNIVSSSGGILTNQASTIITPANFIQNNYFNAPTYMSGSATSGAKYDTGSFTTLNPGFTNAAAGNFKISQFDLITNGIGDARWRQ
ncbi:MAG: fibronectin type III domain-containing protein [Pedobacter sp.]|nr:MAG: fibronectin type III domain-containing protein [Pedobacter sp.]